MILLPECNSEQVGIVLNRMSPLEVEFSGEKIPVSFFARGPKSKRTADSSPAKRDRNDNINSRYSIDETRLAPLTA